MNRGPSRAHMQRPNLEGVVQAHESPNKQNHLLSYTSPKQKCKIPDLGKHKPFLLVMSSPIEGVEARGQANPEINKQKIVQTPFCRKPRGEELV